MAAPATAPSVPTEPLPSAAALAQAAGLLVVGADGKSRTFASLYNDDHDDHNSGSDSSSAKRTLIVFIRHFYCGDCQDYLTALAASIRPHELTAAHARLRIVGCGEPSLIARYAAATSCAFEMYTDRSGSVYDALGMGRSLSRGSGGGSGGGGWGGEEPEYVSRGTVTSVLTSIGQGLRWGAPLGGGDLQRIGGEWMWERGKPLWCHRMKNTRGHLEVADVRALLGLPPAPRRIEWGR